MKGPIVLTAREALLILAAVAMLAATVGLAAGRYTGARAAGAVTWSDVEHYVCHRPAEWSL